MCVKVAGIEWSGVGLGGHKFFVPTWGGGRKIIWWYWEEGGGRKNFVDANAPDNKWLVPYQFVVCKHMKTNFILP